MNVGEVSTHKVRMSALARYQGADTTSSKCFRRIYRPALLVAGKGKYMLSPYQLGEARSERRCAIHKLSEKWGGNWLGGYAQVQRLPL